MIETGPEALIEHASLRHNLQVVRGFSPDSRIWAVIKANAYGHDMLKVAQCLQGADGLAVARVEEGVHLRDAGISGPILVLEGANFDDELSAAGQHQLELAVHHQSQIDLFRRQRSDRATRIWLKVDTGMHRLGLPPEAVAQVLQQVQDLGRRVRLVGVMTHLANADDPHDPFSREQCNALFALCAGLDLPLSIGNSAGLIAIPEARTAWVRPGIMLYGASPLHERTAASLGLRSVMTLKTRLISIQQLRRGDRIGYGGTYSCPEDMSVGVAAIGYGDGYPRHARQGTPVLVTGRRVPLIGRVSMDMINLDLRSAPDSAIGDEVVLWGDGLPADEIAAAAGTIPYELFCAVTARVPRCHIDLGESQPQISKARSKKN